MQSIGGLPLNGITIITESRLETPDDLIIQTPDNQDIDAS